MTSRTFSSSRRIRVADCDATGTIRIDALARYLQDIGYDDTDDLGVGDGGMWVARSIAMDFVTHNVMPQRNEFIHLTTFCGGVGRAFAQRNVELVTESGSRIETSTIWVSVSEEGKPTSVPQWLLDAYPDAAKISASRILPLIDPTHSSDNTNLVECDWVFRASDFDINDHVNNAVAFDALYEVASRVKAQAPTRVMVEYHQPIESHDTATLMFETSDHGFDAWLASGKTVAAAMCWLY